MKQLFKKFTSLRKYSGVMVIVILLVLLGVASTFLSRQTELLSKARPLERVVEAYFVNQEENDYISAVPISSLNSGYNQKIKITTTQPAGKISYAELQFKYNKKFLEPINQVSVQGRQPSIAIREDFEADYHYLTVLIGFQEETENLTSDFILNLNMKSMNQNSNIVNVIELINSKSYVVPATPDNEPIIQVLSPTSFYNNSNPYLKMF